MKKKAPPMEGREVDASVLRVRGSTDFYPAALDYDEDVYMVVKGRVRSVAHGDTSQGFARTQVVELGAIHVIQEADGQRMLDEAAMLAEETFGVASLFRGHRVDGETGEISDEHGNERGERT